MNWQDRKFVKDRVRSFLHIPLNFGAVMVRNMQKIEAAGAKTNDTIVLCDENSLWGADVYISVPKEIPNAENVTISGTFVSKVFEGPYQNVQSGSRRRNASSPPRASRSGSCSATTPPARSARRSTAKTTW